MAILKTFGVLAAITVLSANSITRVNASTLAEEQQPIADPATEALNDTQWTLSPFYEHALGLMKESPLIDTHIDLPQVIRSLG